MTQGERISNPYLYETLNLMIGQAIVVQTEKNIHQGKLISVLPDNIVVEFSRTPLFIRLKEIVWVTLAKREK
ncbi:tyrosyl-tRNA deacylase [Lysinibacillus sp. KCTC 33748]|nr:tyrosyl-tRNA deacylase [Lysinibacillus sp. KCTC 33748]